MNCKKVEKCTKMPKYTYICRKELITSSKVNKKKRQQDKRQSINYYTENAKDRAKQNLHDIKCYGLE